MKADLMLYICIVLATHLTGHMTLGSRVDHIYGIERGPHFKTKVGRKHHDGVEPPNQKVCEQKCPKGFRWQWNSVSGNVCTCDSLLGSETMTIDDPPNEAACRSDCPGEYKWSWRSDTGNQCICVSGKPFLPQASDGETAACIKTCPGSWRWRWNVLQGYVCVCDDAEEDGARKENRSLETKRERKPELNKKKDTSHGSRRKSVKKKDSSQGSRRGIVKKKDKRQSIKRKEENKSRGHNSKETDAPQERRETTEIIDSTYQRGVPQDGKEGTKVNEDVVNDIISKPYQKAEQQPKDTGSEIIDSTYHRGVPQDKEQGKKIGEERGLDSKERAGDKVVPDEPSQPDASHEIATQRRRKDKRRERKQDTQESKERRKGVDDGEKTNKTEGQSQRKKIGEERGLDSKERTGDKVVLDEPSQPDASHEIATQRRRRRERKQDTQESKEKKKGEDDGEKTNKTEGQSKEELRCSSMGCWWMETQDGSSGCTCIRKRPTVAAKKGRRKKHDQFKATHYL